MKELKPLTTKIGINIELEVDLEKINSEVYTDLSKIIESVLRTSGASYALADFPGILDIKVRDNIAGDSTVFRREYVVIIKSESDYIFDLLSVNNLILLNHFLFTNDNLKCTDDNIASEAVSAKPGEVTFILSIRVKNNLNENKELVDVYVEKAIYAWMQKIMGEGVKCEIGLKDRTKYAAGKIVEEFKNKESDELKVDGECFCVSLIKKKEDFLKKINSQVSMAERDEIDNLKVKYSRFWSGGYDHSQGYTCKECGKTYTEEEIGWLFEL